MQLGADAIDGVVHDDADGEHEPRQDHRVERRPRDTAPAPRAASDSGMVTRLISGRAPVERSAPKHAATSEGKPDEQRQADVVVRRLDVVGRPEDAGVDLDAARPGPIASRASSTPPRHLEQRWRPGSFSTTSMSPAPSSRTASPISGWWSSTTLATSPSAQRGRSGLLPSTATLRQVRRVRDRRDVLDPEPLVAACR